MTSLACPLKFPNCFCYTGTPVTPSSAVWMVADASGKKWKKYDENPKIELAFYNDLDSFQLTDDLYIDFDEMIQKSRSKKKEFKVKRECDGPPPAKKQRFASSTLETWTGEVDIVFSFDTTGSMACYLDEVRTKLSEITTRLLKDIAGLRIGIIAHGDYADYGSPYLLESVDLCDNSDTLVNFVNTVRDTSGYDYPEAYEYVLRFAKLMSWRPTASKALVVIGDAPPHSPAEALRQMKQYKVPNPTAINYKKELKELVGKKIKIHGVKANGLSAGPFYDEIALASKGRVIHLKSFDRITELFLALCYKEGGEELYEAYKAELHSKGDLDQNMKTIFEDIDDSDDE